MRRAQKSRNRSVWTIAVWIFLLGAGAFPALGAPAPAASAAAEAAAPSLRPPVVPSFSNSCASSIFCPDCIVKQVGGTFIQYCGLARSNGFCSCSGDCIVSGICTYGGWGGNPPNV